MNSDYAVEVAAKQLNTTPDKLRKELPDLVTELDNISQLLANGGEGIGLKSHETIACIVYKYSRFVVSL